METILAPSWMLTDEHMATTRGLPLLVNRGSQEAFGPKDIVRAYPSWGLMTAKAAVCRMASMCRLPSKSAVTAFLGGL